MEEISIYDLPDTTMIPDGYDMETVPSNSNATIKILLEKINELVQEVNNLTEATK